MTTEVDGGIHLEPFVICEKTEWHQRVPHEEPVDKLLNYVDEGVEVAVGQSCQHWTVPHQRLGLPLYGNDEELHGEAEDVSRVKTMPNG